MNKTKIEWTDYTWNPITGCLKKCWYCYVKRIKDYDRTPTFHPERLRQPSQVKNPRRIFVCSTGDLFGRWVDRNWVDFILKAVRECPQHTFQFLTQNAQRYGEFEFPDNCWLGETITRQDDYSYGLSPYASHQHHIRFASFEPLLSRIRISERHPFDWLIVGAMTGPRSQKYQPKVEWINDIIKQADKLRIPIFLKNNLNKVWKGELRQEFPNGQNNNEELMRRRKEF